MNKEKQKIIADICPFYREYGSCDRCNTAFDIDDPPCYFEYMANAIIDNNYRKVEWISVEERLPEREGYYLTSTIKGVIMIGAFFGYYASGDRPQFKYDVTHWMPLPEAPKKGGGE